MSVFRSAIDDGRGAVDAGYLGLYAVMMVSMGSVPIMAIGLIVQQVFDPGHKFDALMLGQGVGLAAAGFAAAAGAVGAFKRLDQQQHAEGSTTTTTTTAVAAMPPPIAAIAPIPVAIVDDVPVRTQEVKPNAKPTKAKASKAKARRKAPFH